MESLGSKTEYTLDTIPEEKIKEYTEDAIKFLYQLFNFTPTNTEYLRLRNIAK